MKKIIVLILAMILTLPTVTGFGLNSDLYKVRYEIDEVKYDNIDLASGYGLCSDEFDLDLDLTEEELT